MMTLKKGQKIAEGGNIKEGTYRNEPLRVEVLLTSHTQASE